MQIKDEIYKSIAGITGALLLSVLGWAVAIFRAKASQADLEALKKELLEMEQHHEAFRIGMEGHFYSRQLIDDMFRHQNTKIDDIRKDIERLQDSIADAMRDVADDIVFKLKKAINEKKQE